MAVKNDWPCGDLRLYLASLAAPRRIRAIRPYERVVLARNLRSGRAFTMHFVHCRFKRRQ